MGESRIEWTERLVEQFWSKVDRRSPAECWPWQGSKNGRGYGMMRIKRKAFMAHRISLAMKLGRLIREGFNSCHTCDNPPCCNQAHLFEGTQADNISDCRAKGRSFQKLSDSAVMELRLVFPLKRGRRGFLTRMAEKYGVTKQQISNIVYGRQRSGIAH